MDRTNELLLRDQFEPANFREDIIGRVQAYTAGYERDFDLIPHPATGMGAQVTIYSTPQPLIAQYGRRPVAGYFFCACGLSESSAETPARRAPQLIPLKP